MKKSIPVPDEYIRTWKVYSDKLKTDTMTVYNFEPVLDEESGITDFKLVPVLTDVPCRIANQDKQSATENEPARVPKSIRITVSNDIDIKPGSIIELLIDGEKVKYKQSGQEHNNDVRKSIPLEIYEEHAVKEIYEGNLE